MEKGGWGEREKGLRGIMISTHGVGGSWGRQCSAEKAHSESVASYYTDGQ